MTATTKKLALTLTAPAGDAESRGYVPLSMTREADEAIIRESYRSDVLTRVRLDDESLARYVERETKIAMEQYDRAMSTGITSWPMVWVDSDDDARSMSGLYARSMSGDWRKLPL